MSKPEDYGVEVRRIMDDGAFVYEGRVKELPDVRTYGDSQAEAYSAALEVIAITKNAFADKGKAFPEPHPVEDEFSGRITLRMSKSLHRKIHDLAKNEEVSLNHWIIEAIAAVSHKEQMAYASVAWGDALKRHIGSFVAIQPKLLVYKAIDSGVPLETRLVPSDGSSATTLRMLN
jgi:predicted HicB family RNase H-like nuclease